MEKGGREGKLIPPSKLSISLGHKLRMRHNNIYICDDNNEDVKCNRCGLCNGQTCVQKWLLNSCQRPNDEVIC